MSGGKASRRATPVVTRHPEPLTAPEGRSETLIDWAVKYAAPLAGVVGAALYGMLHLTYVFFYLRLEATPHEVGYGYQEILGGQLIGTIELVVLVTALLIAAELAVRAVRRLAVGQWRAAFALPDRATLIRLLRRRGLVALVAVLVCLPMMAWEFGGEARDGVTVHSLYLFRSRIPVLAVQARPATINWLSGHRKTVDIAGRKCLMYLGGADGTAVFFDVRSQESLRLPASQIMLSLPEEEFLPRGCEPAVGQEAAVK